MKVSALANLGLRTDIEMLRFEGSIQERDDCIVVKTPTNPTFYWGNLLVFPEPPRAGELARWGKKFAAAFREEPRVRHRTFTWDTITGEAGAKEEFAGYVDEATEVLLLNRGELLSPPRLNREIEARRLSTEADWAAALESQLSLRPEHLTLESFTAFKIAQMDRYRRMTAAGLGEWFGAFLKGEMIASCGLFLFGGIGRFQTVGTHPSHRRKGGALALMHEACRQGLTSSAPTLVICADPDYHAAQLYRSLGFRYSQKQRGICRYPSEDVAPPEEPAP